MSQIKPDLLYTKDHEWIQKSKEPKIVLMGITDFAQASLGDVTFLQLPEVGRTFKRGEVIGSVESVKAVSDLYAPVSGTVQKINDALVNDPTPVNSDPFGSAWMLEFEMSDEGELALLLNAQAYSVHAQ